MNDLKIVVNEDTTKCGVFRGTEAIEGIHKIDIGVDCNNLQRPVSVKVEVYATNLVIEGVSGEFYTEFAGTRYRLVNLREFNIVPKGDIAGENE